MYLKNLTVLGFKSFADKTTLNFQPGVTAIVGPNGCGKSNVSDAIRWVLGEQSAKALRGGEMADVIFNGTDGRKPLGMAEVSLTIGDVDEEHLKAAGVEVAYNEVTVTRRVFRDGGSEYFINKTSCRLRDIQQLFMGTGIGRTSYSIMAQGNITQILSSKPEDRRMIFEEAAGITKFKSQKKEALRKLESTDQNLLRVADLIREVKRQIGSLQRQAGKARRYKQLMQELQHLDTQLSRHNYDVLQGEITDRTNQVEELNQKIEVGSQNVLRLEDEITTLRSQLSELEQQISENQRSGLELKGQIERHQHRIAVNEQRLSEFDQHRERAQADISQAEERRVQAEQDLEKLALQIDEARVALEEHRGLLDSRRDALAEKENQLRSRQEELRTIQSEAFAKAQQLSHARNELNALDLQKQGNIVRLEKLHSEKIQLHEENSRLEARLQEFISNVEAEKANVQVRRGTVQERQERLKILHHEISTATAQVDDLLRQQAGKRSQLNMLQQLEESHEGFSAGALAILKTSQNVLGSLSDKIRVPDKYVTAIEAALGQNLQLILADQPQTAQELLESLKAGKQGRASIASLGLHLGISAPEEGAPQISAPESALALQVVESEEAIRPLVDALLRRTVIVADLNQATACWTETNGYYDFVTLSGELLSREGIFTGGYANAAGGNAPSSILGRKNQIAEIQHAITGLEESIGEASRNKGALQSEQTELQASLQEEQTELRTREVAIATSQGELNALQNSLRVLAQKIETTDYEIETLTAHEQEGIHKRDGLVHQISELEQGEKTLQVTAAELTEAVETVRHDAESAKALLTETRVSLATAEQVVSALENQKRPLEQRVAEMKHLAEQKQQEIASFQNRKAEAEAEMADSSARIEALQFEREQINTEAAALAEERQNRENEVLERDNAVREERRIVNEAQARRGSLEVEVAQKRMSLQNIRERIQQKYQLNIDDIRSECITITIADEGPAKVETLSPEEMQQQGIATDWNAVGEQVTALQRRIDEMGPVNLVAIEEYEETEQRYNFLTTQSDDLTKAKEQLLEVLERINGQTKEMFTETFNKIRDNFRTMFTEIFGGGSADLILAEGDALECGIDIVARPPGKQLRSISLLSGGEQTMTAVALLFSIYQVKPSPFCVLDELDAPLDESNINRFVKILQRFLSHSQFIIITHNKRTIGMADILYGVTMQEHGVSRIVSVKFHKTEETATLTRSAAPLVPPVSVEATPPSQETPAEEQKPAEDVAATREP